MPFGKFLFSIFVVSFCLVFVTEHTWANDDFAHPKYKDPIEPTTTPIELKYQQVPARSYQKSGVRTIRKGEIEHTTKTKQVGAYQIEAKDNYDRVTMFIKQIEQDNGSGNQILPLVISLSANISYSGEVIGFEFNDRPVDEATLNAGGARQLHTFAATVLAVPYQAVETGDEFYTKTMRSRFQKIGMSPTGIVRGTTSHKGRLSLVVDQNVAVQFPGGAVGEIRGYILVDLEYGLISFSDTASKFDAPNGTQVHMREVLEVDFNKSYFGSNFK